MSEDRNPTPDPAENNAFFPSPYSLSQYTAPKTDFDGVIAQDAYKGPGKVLVIGTEERYTCSCRTASSSRPATIRWSHFCPCTTFLRQASILR